MQIHKCKICGKRFATAGNGRNFYCNECRERITKDYAAWIDGGRKKLKHCLVCGSEIKSRSKIACGMECMDMLMPIVREYRHSHGLTHKMVYKNKAKNYTSPRREKRKPGSMDKLNAIIREAAALGMTYGEYVAQKSHSCSNTSDQLQKILST
jgi:predicted nucleic acid-binding Zn ribbon protein